MVDIPRIRECANLRLPSQNYFIINDAGFTIESGETDYIYHDEGPIKWKFINGNQVCTLGTSDSLIKFVNGNFWEFVNGEKVAYVVPDPGTPQPLVFVKNKRVPVTPRVDMMVSYDGGASFNNVFPYELPPRLMWWQLGIANDAVFQFRFWGMGRFVVTDGLVNIRE